MSKMFFKSLLLVLSVGLTVQGDAKITMPSVSDNWKVSTKAEKAQCVFAGVETLADLFVTVQKGSGSTKAQYARCAVRDAARVTGHAVKAYNSWYAQDRNANKIQEGLLFGYDAMQLFTNGLHALSTSDHAFEKKLMDPQFASGAQMHDYVLSCVAGAVAMCEALAIHPETDAQTRAALQNAYVLARALREASDYRTDMRYLLGVGVLLVANVASWYQAVTGDHDHSVMGELDKMLNQQDVDGKKLDRLVAQAERFNIDLKAVDEQGKNLLDRAAVVGQPAVVKKCRAAGMTLSDELATLNDVCKLDAGKRDEMITELGMDVSKDTLEKEDKDGMCMIDRAAQAGYSHCVAYLLEQNDAQGKLIHDADWVIYNEGDDDDDEDDDEYHSTLQHAIKNKKTAVVEAIVKFAVGRGQVTTTPEDEYSEIETVDNEHLQALKASEDALLALAEQNDDVATGAALLGFMTKDELETKGQYNDLTPLLQAQRDRNYFKMCCLLKRGKDVGAADEHEGLLETLYDSPDAVDMLARHGLVDLQMLQHKADEKDTTLTQACAMLAERGQEKQLAVIAKNADQATKYFLQSEFEQWFGQAHHGDVAGLTADHFELAKAVGADSVLDKANDMIDKVENATQYNQNEYGDKVKGVPTRGQIEEALLVAVNSNQTDRLDVLLKKSLSAHEGGGEQLDVRTIDCGDMITAAAESGLIDVVLTFAKNEVQCDYANTVHRFITAKHFDQAKKMLTAKNGDQYIIPDEQLQNGRYFEHALTLIGQDDGGQATARAVHQAFVERGVYATVGRDDQKTHLFDALCDQYNLNSHNSEAAKQAYDDLARSLLEKVENGWKLKETEEIIQVPDEEAGEAQGGKFSEMRHVVAARKQAQEQVKNQAVLSATTVNAFAGALRASGKSVQQLLQQDHTNALHQKLKGFVQQAVTSGNAAELSTLFTQGVPVVLNNQKQGNALVICHALGDVIREADENNGQLIDLVLRYAQPNDFTGWNFNNGLNILQLAFAQKKYGFAHKIVHRMINNGYLAKTLIDNDDNKQDKNIFEFIRAEWSKPDLDPDVKNQLALMGKACLDQKEVGDDKPWYIKVTSQKPREHAFYVTKEPINQAEGSFEKACVDAKVPVAEEKEEEGDMGLGLFD
ncbi:MAG: hypothetical protein H6679_00420 [Epsilonproteobacteria bacterium]|nr:hypothetical protein [Campylobacterota bacterium]